MTRLMVGNKKRVAFALVALVSTAWSYASDRDLLRDLTKLAEQGNAQAQYNVAMMYNNGIGTTKDIKEAFKWFQKATDSGDALGAYKLGSYYSGQFKDVVAVDEDKALHYKLIAATAGYSYAQSDVGIMYFGKGKYDETRKWWTQAAEQGLPVALFNLSVLYGDNKISGKKDAVLNYAYFKLAKLKADGQINSKAQSSLDQLKSAMSPADFSKAEQIVSGWEDKPTPLTLRAAEGIEEAKKLLSAAK